MNDLAKAACAVPPPGSRSGALDEVARRLVWWQPPEAACREPARLIAQVMTLGTWKDVQVIRRVFGRFCSLPETP